MIQPKNMARKSQFVIQSQYNQWMGRFTGMEFQVESLVQELYSDFEALWKARNKTDTAINSWLDSLSESDLDQIIAIQAVVTQQSHRFRLADALTHFFHHQTHHRGQITTLLSQLGYNFGVTDMMWMPGIEIINMTGIQPINIG